LKYPYPFDNVVRRNVSIYDNIDLVQGDDEIHGGPGNDVLYGQRGDDVIYGDEGEDELHGGLGSDELYGGPGDDILLGDTGHCVRRYDTEGSPILLSNTTVKVWKKDIVLEELGTITKVVSISRKVDTGLNRQISAADTTSASIIFVANAFQEDGEKYKDEDGIWLTDLLLFDLVESYDDILHDDEGSNVLIGQRGDDNITGSGLLIGDAGQNLIPQNTDLPRIYQIYRTLSAPAGSGYEVGPNEVDFGVAFTSDFELYPNQYRFVDYMQSIIDVDVTLNDLQEESHLIKDILGVSTLATDKGYCMQPMFRITPGLKYDKQKLHGNDLIRSSGGPSIVIGDDIRGAAPFDLTQVATVDNLRQTLDNLVVDLSVRLSTMEVDTGFFLNSNSESMQPLTVGCDNITTGPEGHAFVTGDSLTMFGRSFLGGSLGQGPASKVEDIVHRLRDIELVLIEVHFALYELHTKLLRDMQDSGIADQKASQLSQYALTISGDTITSNGEGDVLVGDGAVLFAQANRDEAGFEFEELSSSVAQSLKSTLKALTTARDDARDAHVLNHLKPTASLTNTEQSGLPFADVPFLLNASSDTLHQGTTKNLGVGDYGFLGFVASATAIDASDTRKDLYADSMESIRKNPAVSSFFASLTVLKSKIDFYEERYTSQVAKVVEPSLFGDHFFGESSDNAMLGEFVTAIGYGVHSDPSTFVFDSKARGTFDTFDNAVRDCHLIILL